MNKIYEQAQKELGKFNLPTGYSLEDTQISKVYLASILKLLKLGLKKESKLTKDLYWLLIDTIGKMSNIQGYEIIICLMPTNENENYIHEYNSKILSVDIALDKVDQTLDSLAEFVNREDTFVPKKDDEKSAYFHDGSVIITQKTLTMTK